MAVVFSHEKRLHKTYQEQSYIQSNIDIVHFFTADPNLPYIKNATYPVARKPIEVSPAQRSLLCTFSQAPSFAVAVAIIVNLTANVKHHLAIQTFAW